MVKKSYSFIKDKNKNKFLNNYVTYGTICKAAAKTGIVRQTHYDWMHNDDAYKVAYSKAEAMVADMLEDEAKRRAMGYETKIYYKGEEVGSEMKYSDALLTLLLKGAKPDKYKDRVQNETVDMGAAAMTWEGIEDGETASEEDNNSIQTRKAVAKKDTSKS